MIQLRIGDIVSGHGKERLILDDSGNIRYYDESGVEIKLLDSTITPNIVSAKLLSNLRNFPGVNFYVRPDERWLAQDILSWNVTRVEQSPTSSPGSKNYYLYGDFTFVVGTKGMILTTVGYYGTAPVSTFSIGTNNNDYVSGEVSCGYIYWSAASKREMSIGNSNSRDLMCIQLTAPRDLYGLEVRNYFVSMGVSLPKVSMLNLFKYEVDRDST